MSTELISVICYLRDMARTRRKKANTLLAESSMNAVEAREWDAQAKSLEQAAEKIERGEHLR